jgi:hypothetical protein
MTFINYIKGRQLGLKACNDAIHSNIKSFKAYTSIIRNTFQLTQMNHTKPANRRRKTRAIDEVSNFIAADNLKHYNFSNITDKT